MKTFKIKVKGEEREEKVEGRNKAEALLNYCDKTQKNYGFYVYNRLLEVEEEQEENN